ncbi:MAG: transketolase [Candidatus Paceibacterota bacterium]|jgi:transketolase
MEILTDTKIRELQIKANEIRISIIEMLMEAGSGHTAGAMGLADIFTYLYFHAMKHNPKDPFWPDRDRLILSNGHVCPVLYASMAHSGYFPVEELLTLRKFGSRLQGHPHREFLPMLETSSGPLGEGLSQTVGMALADRMDGIKDRFFYCSMGDGELNEGEVWEAVMLAGKEKLDNIISFIDRNYIQIDGNTEDIMPLEPLSDKWKSFNWHVIEADGHDFKSLNEAFKEAKNAKGKPIVIIAKMIPGKGIKEIEGNYKWHGMPPNKEQGVRFLEELRIIGGRL